MQNQIYAEPEKATLPASDMKFDLLRVALVVVDPQNDSLHEKGVAWGVVGESVTEHSVVQHLEKIFFGRLSELTSRSLFRPPIITPMITPGNLEAAWKR